MGHRDARLFPLPLPHAVHSIDGAVDELRSADQAGCLGWADLAPPRNVPACEREHSKHECERGQHCPQKCRSGTPARRPEVLAWAAADLRPAVSEAGVAGSGTGVAVPVRAQLIEPAVGPADGATG